MTDPWPGLHIYLAGGMAVSGPAGTADGRALGSRQARLVLANLALGRCNPIPRATLAEAVWGPAMPEAWDMGLAALVSRLRGVLARVEGTRAGDGVRDGDESQGLRIVVADGCLALRLPSGSWIDIEAAFDAVDKAENALRAGDVDRAWAEAAIAQAIARRPFLPGETLAWVRRGQVDLGAVAVRALACLSEAAARRGRAEVSVKAASDAVQLSPGSETAWRALMRAHAAAGDRAEALRAYSRLRASLRDELGVDPSPSTQALYVDLLRS